MRRDYNAVVDNKYVGASCSLRLGVFRGTLSDGKGRLTPHQLPLRTGEPWFAAIADLNGDGRPDIVATHHDQSAMTAMIGDGRGGFTEANGSPFDFGVSLFHLIIADVDRDGRMDLVATSGDSIRVLLGDGRGAFKPAASIPVGPGEWRIGTADLNGDGTVDVVTSNSESNSLSVLLGKLASKSSHDNAGAARDFVIVQQ